MMKMVNTIPTLDVEAFDTFDRQRLLRILARAIDETAEIVGDEWTLLQEGDPERIRYLRTLVTVMQACNDTLALGKGHRIAEPMPAREQDEVKGLCEHPEKKAVRRTGRPTPRDARRPSTFSPDEDTDDPMIARAAFRPSDGG